MAHGHVVRLLLYLNIMNIPTPLAKHKRQNYATAAFQQLPSRKGESSCAHHSPAFLITAMLDPFLMVNEAMLQANMEQCSSPDQDS